MSCTVSEDLKKQLVQLLHNSHDQAPWLTRLAKDLGVSVPLALEVITSVGLDGWCRRRKPHKIIVEIRYHEVCTLMEKFGLVHVHHAKQPVDYKRVADYQPGDELQISSEFVTPSERNQVKMKTERQRIYRAKKVQHRQQRV